MARTSVRTNGLGTRVTCVLVCATVLGAGPAAWATSTTETKTPAKTATRPATAVTDEAPATDAPVTLLAQQAPAYPPPAYPPPAYPAPPPPVVVPYPVGPKRMAYEDGQPVPAGYRVEDRVRQGPVIAGALLLGIPYVIGLTIASIADYKNQSGWLAVPAAGPWLMLFLHKSPDCNSSTSNCPDDALDFILRFYLTIDGVLQATGTGLLLFGLSGRKLLIRDDVAFTVRPMPMGNHGYGPAVIGRF